MQHCDIALFLELETEPLITRTSVTYILSVHWRPKIEDFTARAGEDDIAGALCGLSPCLKHNSNCGIDNLSSLCTSWLPKEERRTVAPLRYEKLLHYGSGLMLLILSQFGNGATVTAFSVQRGCM